MDGPSVADALESIYWPYCTCLIQVPINVRIPSCHMNASFIFSYESLGGGGGVASYA